MADNCLWILARTSPVPASSPGARPCPVQSRGLRLHRYAVPAVFWLNNCPCITAPTWSFRECVGLPSEARTSGRLRDFRKAEAAPQTPSSAYAGPCKRARTGLRVALKHEDVLKDVVDDDATAGTAVPRGSDNSDDWLLSQTSRARRPHKRYALQIQNGRRSFFQRWKAGSLQCGPR